MNTETRQGPPRETHSKSPIEWRALLVWTGLALPIVLIVALVAVGRLIPPVVVLAALYFAGVALSRRGGKPGAVLMGVPSLILIAREVPRLAVVLPSPSTTVVFVTTTVTVALAAANLIAAGATLLERPSGRVAALVARATLVVLVIVVGVAAVAAGTSTDNVSGGSENSNPVTDPVITIEDMSFSGGTITVEAGTAVTWVWEDAPMDHNVHGDDFKSPLQAEGSFTHTFDDVGIFDYQCDPHPFMSGTITVVAVGDG